MNRSAFSRAWDYVGYSRTNKWLAMLGAAGSGATYVLLILILGLFADLLVSRGHIPTFADLNDAERAHFRDQWNGLAPEQRLETLKALPMVDQQRAGLEEPAIKESEPLELRWKAYLGMLFEQRVGSAAADSYRQLAVAHEGAAPATDPDRVQLGALSLVARARNSVVAPVLCWLVQWNSWTWTPTAAGTPNRPYLTGLLVLAVLIALIRFGLVSLMYHCATRATLEAVTRLRRLIYHHTYRLGSLTVTTSGAREAQEVFTRHVDHIHDGLYARLTIFVREPVKIVLLVIVALAANIWLGLATLFAAGLVWIAGRQTTALFRRFGRSGGRRALNQLSLLEESLRMMRLVKGYLMDLFNQGRVERQLSEYSRAQIQRFRGELVYRPLLIFLGSMAGAVLLFVAGLLVLGERLEIGSLVVLATAVCSLYAPLDSWLGHRRLLRRAEESAVTMFEFLDRRGEVGQVVGAEFLKAMSKRIEFDHVVLKEPGGSRLLLDDLSLTIRAGQRVAFVGADPHTRQAIAAMIPRFLDPSGGEVRIDGKNLRWVTLDSLRAQVALVMQDHAIFNDTVLNNIGCGDPSYAVPQIFEAAKQVHAHNFIQRLPYGYETHIGELGHSLSPGEQFRIGLARAILRDPAVLVIEEPRVVLDDGTKKMLDDAYARILPERTVILFPQRLSTLKSCDHVFLVRDGKLVAEGEHRELLRDNELYRHQYYLEYYAVKEET